MRSTIYLYISHINNIQNIPLCPAEGNDKESNHNILIINLVEKTFTTKKYTRAQHNIFTLKNSSIYNLNDLPTYFSNNWVILADNSSIEKNFNLLEKFLEKFHPKIHYIDVNLLIAFSNISLKNTNTEYNCLGDLATYLEQEYNTIYSLFLAQSLADKDSIELTKDNWGYITYDLCNKIIKPRIKHSHKGTYGHALIIGGSLGMMGAVQLSSKAAIRSGCGLISVVVPERLSSIIQSSVPEAMIFECIENIAYKIPDSLKTKINAIGIGPGMGQDNTAVKGLTNILNNTSLPLVIDADGLNSLKSIPSWHQKIKGRAILTPHIGEFDRLFGFFSNSVDRVRFAKKFVSEHNIVILIKGAYTFVVSKNQITYINSTGNNGMSTGGSGDVLTGIITSFLAQGYELTDAALLGAFLHGLSGDCALETISEESIIASDLVDHIPKAFIKLKSFES